MKVLLFSNINYLANIGGPVGYQYNIAEYLKENPRDEISFLQESWHYYGVRTRIANLFFRVLKIVFKKSKAISFGLSIYEYYYRHYCISKKGVDFLNSFDTVHIHSLPQVLQFFKKNKIKAKIILTSHTPEPVIDQLFSSNGYGMFLANHPKLRDRLIKRELRAFDLCDKIMFPVPQAREPYEQASGLYANKFKELDSKFFYVPTALNSIDRVKENDHVLDKYNLPNDCLRVCYIGRHNEVKGYDFLKRGAVEVWKNNHDVRFVIGGKQEPLKGIEDERWIELGWVNTPKLLNEVDVFVLPNKNTYFDLILLEVLRQGTPVILSRTGGNKWFEDKKVRGLMFFEYGQESEFVECIEKLSMLKAIGELESIKEDNMRFFKSEFNMQLYIERYLDSLTKICYTK